MPDLRERIEADRRAFSAQLSRASNEELENALRYGQLTMSNWKADMVIKELRYRQREGIVKVGLNVAKGGRPLAKPAEPAPKKTAWDVLLDDDLV
jgi:hypothetical protein